MIKLYYCPQTRASRVRWTLEELEVPYQLVRLDLKNGEHRQPEYLKINPLGLVPAIDDDGEILIESGGICAYLVDKFSAKGLGPTPAERGKYFQWCYFQNGTLEVPLMDYFLHSTRLPEADRCPSVAERGLVNLGKALEFVEANLQGRSYLLGERFTLPDLLLGGSLFWIHSMKLLEGRTRLQEYVRTIAARPAFKKANAD